MLEKLVVEILLGELGIESKERAVLLCRIRERTCVRHILRTILRHFPLSGIIVFLRGLVLSQQIVHV